MCGEPFFGRFNLNPITCEGRVVMAGGELIAGSMFTFWLLEGGAASSGFLGVDPADEVSGQVVGPSQSGLKPQVKMNIYTGNLYS